MAIVIGPISLEHPSIGRVLVSQINTDVIAMLRQAGGVDGTEFFRRLLALSARKGGSEEAASGIAAYKQGTALTSEEIAVLSPEEIEELAGQYLASKAAWQVRDDEGVEGNAERLLAAAKRISAEHDASSERIRKKIEAMGVSDDLKAMMAKTSEASRALSDILGPSNALRDAMRQATSLPQMSDALKAALEPSPGMKALMEAAQTPAMTAVMEAALKAEKLISPSVGDLIDRTKGMDLGRIEALGPFHDASGVFPREPEGFHPTMPKIEIPRSPIFDTNAILRRVSGDIERMVEISERQSQLVGLLSDTANLALGEAASSSAEAKRSAELAKEATTFTKWSVVVAVFAVFLSVAISGFAIWDTRRIAEGNDAMTKELIEAVREGTRVSHGVQQEIKEQEKAAEERTKALLDRQETRAVEAAIGRPPLPKEPDAPAPAN